MPASTAIAETPSSAFRAVPKLSHSLSLSKVTRVLIPAHDEERAISEVVRGCLRHADEVWVVADGCSDNTAQTARGAGARVIEFSRRQGKARALRAGWEKLLALQDWDNLVLLDGDGQHDPEDIPRLLAVARRNPCLLVIGSRAPFALPMPRLRRWVNAFMSISLSLMSGRKLPDSQCGFRVVPRVLVEKGGWHSGHYEIESEIILRAARMGLEITSIPVGCHYGAERSSIQPWRDTARWLAFCFRAARS